VEVRAGSVPATLPETASAGAPLPAIVRPGIALGAAHLRDVAVVGFEENRPGCSAAHQLEIDEVPLMANRLLFVAESSAIRGS
jgi:hypothetical protein